jgi:hypothetical protein
MEAKSSSANSKPATPIAASPNTSEKALLYNEALKAISNLGVNSPKNSAKGGAGCAIVKKPAPSNVDSSQPFCCHGGNSDDCFSSDERSLGFAEALALIDKRKLKKNPPKEPKTPMAKRCRSSSPPKTPKISKKWNVKPTNDN